MSAHFYPCLIGISVIMAQDVQLVFSMDDPYSDLASIPRKPLAVRILTPALFSPFIIGTYQFIGPAFDSALEDISDEYPLLNVTQEVIPSGTINTCAEWSDNVERVLAAVYYKTVKLRTEARAKNQSLVIALVTGGCTETFLLARLAKEWNILYITSITATAEVRLKSVYPTWLTTTVNTLAPFVQVYPGLMRRYNWTTVVFVVDLGSNPYFAIVGNAAVKDLQLRKGYQVDYLTFNSTKGLVDYDTLLKLIQKTTRVCFYLGHSTPLRDLLITASSLNMTNGDYVYIAMMPFRHTMLGNFTWKFGDQLDGVAREAYSSVLLVEPESLGVHSEKSNGNSRNLEDVWRRSSADVYRFPYANNISLSPHPASSYAAFMLLAQVLHEVYASGIDTDYANGSFLAKYFLNRTYSFRTGNISLNNVGERILQVHIRQLKSDSSDFQDVFTQDGRTFALSEIAAIRWKGSWPIPDIPLCNLNGKECSNNPSVSSALLYGAIIGGAVLAVLAAFTYARITRQKDGNWWEMAPAELLNKNSEALRRRSLALSRALLEMRHRTNTNVTHRSIKRLRLESMRIA